jgi:hypothetical protein
VSIYRHMLLASLIVGVTACKPNTPPPQDSPASAEAAQSVVKSSENGMLTVSPAAISACDSQDVGISSDVSWNAASVGTEGVEVWLQNPEGEKKLWSASGAVDKSTTGPWMRVGSVVILVNGEDKKELARIDITSIPCER